MIKLTRASCSFVTIRVIGVVMAVLFSLLVPVAQMHAQTQAAMNAEAWADFKKVDAELNSAYAALMAKLPDAEGKEKLKQSQRAWIAFRDAEAAFAAGGGTILPMTPLLSGDCEGSDRIRPKKWAFLLKHPKIVPNSR
jgi:uncharacterized protein YecT (DUF1311 family)